MKAVIVDDEEMARESLLMLCSKIKELDILEAFNNGLEALEFLKNNKVEVIFLDIEMPDFSGIDLLKTLNQSPQIIFTTSKKDYAVDAFEFEATDFITKPVQLPRLIKAVERAEKQLASIETSSNDEYDEVFIRVDGKYIKLGVMDILYVETLGDYVTFNTIDNKKYIVHSTLKGMDNKLNSRHFAKVHRSYIVNVHYIVDIEETNLVLKDKIIPVSRANKATLLSKIKTV